MPLFGVFPEFVFFSVHYQRKKSFIWNILNYVSKFLCSVCCRVDLSGPVGETLQGPLCWLTLATSSPPVEHWAHGWVPGVPAAALSGWFWGLSQALHRNPGKRWNRRTTSNKKGRICCVLLTDLKSSETEYHGMLIWLIDRENYRLTLSLSNILEHCHSLWRHARQPTASALPSGGD